MLSDWVMVKKGTREMQLYIKKSQFHAQTYFTNLRILLLIDSIYSIGVDEVQDS